MLMPIPDDAFFREWIKEACNGSALFYLDGVVDPSAWSKVRPRVLVLLREVNWVRPIGGDLRIDLRLPETPLGSTFKITAYWIYGVINRCPPWKSLAALEGDDALLDSLKRIYLRLGAVMNLKKIPGGNRVDWKSFNQVVEDHAPFIRRQIDEHIRPDLIICGGTFDDLLRIYRRESEVASASNGVRYFHSTDAKWCAFSALHPAQSRDSHEMLYSQLMNAVREVKLGDPAA